MGKLYDFISRVCLNSLLPSRKEANVLALLAQSDTTVHSSGAGAIAMAIGCFALLLELGILVLVIAGLWKVFAKAGKPGWTAIIPIYNAIVMLDIIGKPLWWIILLFIPFVNIVIGILIAVELAKAFGKGIGFAIGLVFLGFIFIPILGFGSAQYQGQQA
jgi:hypothetical protein